MKVGKTRLNKIYLAVGVLIALCLFGVFSMYLGQAGDSADRILPDEPQTHIREMAHNGKLFGLINDERAKRNIQPLVLNEKLEKSACLKAQDMAAREYYSHDSPNGHSSSVLFDEVGYIGSDRSENIAVFNFDQYSAKEAVNSWMASEAHRNAILGTNTESGVCTADGYLDGEHVTFAVQHFGTPR